MYKISEELHARTTLHNHTQKQAENCGRALTCCVEPCFLLVAVVVVMSLIEGAESERLPPAAALDCGVMEEDGMSPTSRALPLTLMCGCPSAAMLRIRRPL